MLSGRTTTTISQPAHGPMDINAGKPEWRELLPLFGIVLLALLVAALGAAGLVAAWPRTEYEVSGWRWLGAITGAAFAWGGGTVAWSLRAAIVRSVTSWQDRLGDWHQ